MGIQHMSEHLRAGGVQRAVAPVERVENPLLLAVDVDGQVEGMALAVVGRGLLRHVAVALRAVALRELERLAFHRPLGAVIVWGPDDYGFVSATSREAPGEDPSPDVAVRKLSR